MPIVDAQPAADAEPATNAKAEADLRALIGVLRDDSARQRLIDELERNLPRMRKTGAKIIRCMSYPNDEKNPLPDDRWKAECVRRLSELARRCADGGVILGHENCSGYGGENPERTLELLEAVDNPAFKVIFDSGNASSHADDPEASCEYYEKTKEHIAHIHIKAFKRGPDGKLGTCYPDEDPVQARVLSALKRDGYDGYISIEPHMKAAVHTGKDVDDAEEATKVFIEYGRRVMKLAEEA